MEFVPNAFNSSIGALYVANVLSPFFLGVVLSKAWEYFFRYRSDRPILKFAAATTVLGSIAETCIYASWGYMWSSQYYGLPQVMANAPAQWPLSIINISLVTLANQCFYAWRVWNLGNRSKIIPGIIVFLSLYQFGYVLYLAPFLFGHREFAKMKTEIFPVAYTWLVASALADAVITASLIWYILIKSAGRFRHKSHSLFFRISLQAIQFNFFSLITQCLEFILFLTTQGLYFSLFTATLAKVYSFALLVSLTSRESTEISGQADPTSGSADLGTSKGPRSRFPATSGINVNVHSSTIIDADHPEWGTRGTLGNLPVNIQLKTMPEGDTVKFRGEEDL